MPLMPPDHIRQIRPYEPGKPVEEVERELGLSNTIKLASNENPLGPSPLAVKALQRAIATANRYPDGGGYYLCHALAERNGVSADQIVLGNGSTELVEILARSYLGHDGNAVISEQAFIMYQIAVQAVNGNAIMVPMKGRTHDLDAMARAVNGKTRLIFVANPNNPTGTSVGAAPLQRLLDAVPEGTLLVVDEAYREYAEGFADYPETLPLVRQGAPLVVLRTFSKIYGLAGLRIGYAIAPQWVVREVNKVRSPFNTNSLAQIAALAALKDREHLERSRQRNREGLKVLQEGLSELGFLVTPSVTNFVLVEVAQPARAAFERLLKLGVIVRPMDGYGIEQGLRVSVGTREENQRVLEAFDRALKRP
ncbi:MAG: histidinol-phosphate transaminase [Acidobacteria bacterium]|nr:MAG: histidinol-phosphate transaminase [Acidobacteriota bacterium]